MELTGICHCFGDNVSTDDIIAGKYKNRILDIQELTAHVMENLDPGFADRFKPGDFIVAGKNFGAGSSREVAARLILEAGCAAVLAKSFARIFFRNSFNVGLLLLECDTGPFGKGDKISINLEQGRVVNLKNGVTIEFKPHPLFMKKVLDEGGLVAHFKKHGGFAF